MFGGGFPDIINNETDPKYDEGAHEDDLENDGKSQDSELEEMKQKLGPLDDEDPQNDNVGDILEITHDGKVTKEILEVGEGARMKMGYQVMLTYAAYFFKDHVIFE